MDRSADIRVRQRAQHAKFPAGKEGEPFRAARSGGHDIRAPMLILPDNPEQTPKAQRGERPALVR